MLEQKIGTPKAAPPKARALLQGAGPQAPADPRWSAVEARDGSARFLYGVVSTGIYCRPGCASKRPKRDNVCFFESAAEAEARGFRACLRCTPNQAEPRTNEQVRAMCEFIEHAAHRPSLSEVAAIAGLSPSHAQRIFVSAMKLSPKEYYQRELKRRLDRELSSEGSLLAAAHAAGFESKSDLYVKAKDWFGATPKERRAALEVTGLRVSFGSSSLGNVLVAESPRGIAAVLLGDARDGLVSDLGERFPRAQLTIELDVPSRHIEDIVSVLEGHSRGVSNIPLDLWGTPFQVQVWQALISIPWGATMSYAELAAKLGRPRATRAVASACASNPIAVLVPCHRIVRADGGLGGYRWGLEHKRALLERETPHLSKSQRKSSKP